LLRSEAMAHGTLILPVQDPKKYVDKIGKETSVQFEDMNAREMRRPYRKYVQRIEEMERILRFLFEEMGKVEGCKVTRNFISEFLEADASDQYQLDSLELELQQLYENFVKIKDNNAKLVEERNQSVEELMVAEVALRIFQGGQQVAATSIGSGEESFEVSAKKPLIGKDDVGIGRLGNLSGVLLKADEARFTRALWRASSGNVYSQFFNVDDKVIDPKTGATVAKSVFVIYFQGEAGYLHGKINKVCQAFGANMYTWPGEAQQAQSRYQTLNRVLEEKDKALAGFQKHMQVEAADLLAPSSANANGNSKIEDWRLFCTKEKSIYSVLNLCQEGMTLRADIWYPAADEAKIQTLLAETNEGLQQQAILCPDRGNLHRSIPPTYIRTNEYTEAFQEVINTYGIPKYQEANPALLTLVTFPFIFGMMYGDVGHGSMLLLTGLFLCWKAESFRFSMPAVFQARFMVLSMGVFATFAGFMYNDFFSIGLPIFATRWVDPDGDGHYTPDYDVKNSGGTGPYPFGVDWVWEGASNELLYMNSLKMKLSVLFGVLQMIVGVLLRWSNAAYEKSSLDFICECLPMMVFMLCFFGWMDVMILYKWTHPVDTTPSIINSMICMAMGQEDLAPMWDGSVQLAQKLMLYTVCAVPVMLLPKPFVLLWQHNKTQEQKSKGLLAVDEEVGGHGGDHGHGEEFEFGEIFIHQIIETIEYVLGTVSHTASYLRIWALSLAHQQLSQVFFDKTLKMGLAVPAPMNGVVIYLMFVAWFGITVGVLLGMDVLECFLHTLRLHWVEFQSKFYKSNGEKFMPYNVRTLLEQAED